jgi:hypothetical protein
MATDENSAGVDLQELADEEAVLRHAFRGEPLDPEIARRVRGRAAQVTEGIYRVHGLIDDEAIHDLLRGDDENDEP